MQKWEKQLVIILFVLGILGGFIGVVMSKSGVGDIIVFDNIDIFGILELTLFLIVIACTAFDVYETLESRLLLGDEKFKVTLSSRNRLKYILIFLILSDICELGIFLNSIDMHLIPLFLITVLLTFMVALHSQTHDMIGEQGLLYCGIFHSWDDVKSCNITSEALLEMKIMNNFFSLEYENIIKFNIDEKDKKNIESYLEKKICIIDESNAI
ncbi:MULTISPECIES: DUF986 family protein [unclassified Clostridium]|uniref:DUF986 family protein n=1 Tax=unclassified Clostridium TaxID=2614128 RepID=UPI00029782A7|nr:MULTISPECIES: DUF986 family protein [unclassified Clostridium]EKQ51594.1 MAG: Protein of unknown function (DUF986) [Clostridium sp. Maddingley MBC34-26]